MALSPSQAARGLLTAAAFVFAVLGFGTAPAHAAAVDGIVDVTVSPTTVNIWDPVQTNLRWCVPAGARAAMIGFFSTYTVNSCTATYVDITLTDIPAGQLVIVNLHATPDSPTGGATTVYRNTANFATTRNGITVYHSPSAAITSSDGSGGGTGAGSSLSFTKSATTTDINGDGVLSQGDRISWSFALTNRGTGLVTAIGVTDPTAGDITCRQGELSAGQSTTCSAAVYQITAADVAAGMVKNTATAWGTENGVQRFTNSSSTNTAVVAAQPTPVTTTTATPTRQPSAQTQLPRIPQAGQVSHLSRYGAAPTQVTSHAPTDQLSAESAGTQQRLAQTGLTVLGATIASFLLLLAGYWIRRARAH